MRKSKKALLSDFSNDFIIREVKSENMKCFCVHEANTRSIYLNLEKFIGYFTLPEKMNGYVFRNNLYENANDVIDAMKAYNSTLLYDPELNYPFFRKDFKLEAALRTYLEKMSIKMSKNSVQSFVYKDMFGIEMFTIQLNLDKDFENTFKGTLTIGLNADTFMDSSFDSIDSAIGACNSLISFYCITHNNMDLLGNLTEARNSTEEVTIDYSSFSVMKHNAVKKTISLLEKELEKLREIEKKLSLGQ